MKTFKDKVVVITGAGSGIGRALTMAFASEGALLALNDYNATTLKETVDMLKVSEDAVFQSAFDISDKDAVFKFAEDIIAHYGKVDVLINNAGVALGKYRFEEFDLDMFERVMQVNFNGVLYGCRAFIPYLTQRPDAVLVNISSVFGLAGVGLNAPYCASKFAVYGLTQCLMQEHANSNLMVHSVHPGGINTNISKNAVDYNEVHDTFHKKFLKRSPESAAKTIINGIRRKKARILIGGEARQLDFVVRLLPVKGVNLVNKMIRKKMGSALKDK